MLELLELAESGRIELMLGVRLVRAVHDAPQDECGFDRAEEQGQASARSDLTDAVAGHQAAADNITELLTRSAQQAEQRFRDVRTRLVDGTLDTADRRDAAKREDLARPRPDNADAIVLASVLGTSRGHPVVQRPEHLMRFRGRIYGPE